MTYAALLSRRRGCPAHAAHDPIGGCVQGTNMAASYKPLLATSALLPRHQHLASLQLLCFCPK